jgi:CRISPR system Cascade subunit CasE
VSLHLVRLGVDLQGLAAFAVANAASDDDNGYALHLALRQRFGAAAPQPFRLFAEARSGPHLLGYLSDPAALADAAALPVLEPLLGRVFTGDPATHAMPETWREGALFGFEARVRPVVRFGGRVREARAAQPAAQAREGWWARAGEVDAWIAARTHGADRGLWAEDGGDAAAVQAATDASPTREDAYVAWLAKRLEGAAVLQDAGLRQFRRSRVRRSSHGAPGRGRVEGPDALIAGTLAVADPAAFHALLARGIGRHAAFGYGMLVLSPPGRRP